MATRALRTVEIDVLRDVMERLLVAVGCKPDVAAPIADIFLEADLRGVSTQGLHHLVHIMIETFRAGKIAADAKPRIVKQGPAFALIDAARGPGQLGGLLAANVAAGKAKQAGSAAVGIVNSNDFFMAGYYGERIARAGCIGLVFSDSPPLVHPFGGSDRVLGTNPFVIAVPTAEDHPMVLDFATSARSRSVVRQAAEHGERIPEGVAVGSDGLPTTDSAEAMAGALSPLAGHKGYGLGLCVALLAGPTVGAAAGKVLAGWLPRDPGPLGNKGHLLIAIDPGAFGNPGAFRRSASAYLAAIKASKPAPGAEIRIPGERLFRMRERNVRAGTVTVFETTWAYTQDLAKELGVAMPA